MPVCARCRRTQATAELRRRKPPYTGDYVCKDIFDCERHQPEDVKPGARVTTPLGPGVVRNVARSGGIPTTVLVLLDGDRDAVGHMAPEAVWRAFDPKAVTA